MSSPTHELTIRVDFDGRHGWEVELGDARIACATFDDARRIAFLKAARRRPCQLVVRDAYHRVIERAHIDAAAPASSRS
jgi:hypothetical protein